MAWLFKYFQIIKAKEKRGEVARNRQKVITQEQITSISAPETDTNLPDRERES